MTSPSLPSPDCPTVLEWLSPKPSLPNGQAIVSNPRGTARLQMVWDTRPISAPESGSLDRYEVFLVLDDIPLIRRHMNGCPTCEQLLQNGIRTAAQAAALSDAINQLTVADFRSGPERWFESLMPIIELFPAGTCRVDLLEFYPTDGDGKFFWTAHQRLSRCTGLSNFPHAHERLEFLAATQPPACFRAESMDQALRDFALKPGIACDLDQRVAALLDGHHRALAAALAHERFPCICISPLTTAKEALADKSWCLPEGMQANPATGGRYSWPGREMIDSSLVDAFVEMVDSAPEVEIPSDFAPRDLDSIYPTSRSLANLERIGGPNRAISDSDIESILTGRHPLERFYCGSMLSDVMNALGATSDARGIALGIQVAKNRDFVPHWAEAFRLLANFRCETVDDFFVAFLCHEDSASRLELVEIVDDYFRKAPR